MTTLSRVVADLLAARGIGRHELFLTQAEGRPLPGGLEATSGFVATADGRVYGFWLDWDPASDAFCLEPFWRVADPRELGDDPEYRAAVGRLRAAGR